MRSLPVAISVPNRGLTLSGLPPLAALSPLCPLRLQSGLSFRVEDHGPNDGDVSVDGPLEWVPDGGGLLISGTHFHDRRTGYELYRLPVKSPFDVHHKFLDADHLLTNFSDSSAPLLAPSLQSYAIPWADLRKSLAAVTSGEPALLRPDGRLRLQVELKNLRGDREQTRGGNKRDNSGGEQTGQLWGEQTGQL